MILYWKFVINGLLPINFKSESNFHHPLDDFSLYLMANVNTIWEKTEFQPKIKILVFKFI